MRFPIRGPRARPSGGKSQIWGQGGRCCCQDWTLEISRGPHSLMGSPSRALGLCPVEEPATCGARLGGAAAKVGLWKWVGSTTASGAPPAGAPGLGPLEEPASGGLRMGGIAGKTGLWEWIGAPTGSGGPPSEALGQGPVEEPASGGLRVGETASRTGLWR